MCLELGSREIAICKCVRGGVPSTRQGGGPTDDKQSERETQEHGARGGAHEGSTHPITPIPERVYTDPCSIRYNSSVV